MPVGARQRQFLNYYLSLPRHDFGLPHHNTIAPRQIVKLLPWIFIADLKAEEEVTIRLAGTGIEDIQNASLTGLNLFDTYGADKSRYRMLFEKITSHPCGALTDRATFSSDKIHGYYQSLYLPLSDDSGAISRIIGIITMEGTGDSPFLSEPRNLDSLMLGETSGFWLLDIGHGLPNDTPFGIINLTQAA